MEFLLILIVLITISGLGTYYITNRPTALQRRNTNLRLQDLKDTIQQADRQVRLLDNYLADQDYTQYSIVARQLLPKLDQITAESEVLKNNMDLKIYRRVTKKANDVKADVTLQLERLHIATDLEPASEEETKLLKRAPELTTIYHNIQRDHRTIMDKIKEADNRAELTALHENNMRRFDDILTGYLKIKESPKDYYNAEERLAEAKEALQQFDLELDETLRQLNESGLKDFDVSLRMMRDKV
ncbi:hypothetical protein [Streptococcus thoraltensis]|uniref:hypothetical protein n=1 Tax=Streptococcus thoraltensis TaxID=55085 RepID=UPI0003746F75|nr:hypothetical protein [Streptococcus thoraltensis]